MLDHLLIKSSFINSATIDIIYACLLAFCLGVGIAVAYVKTFRGLSYSRAYLQSVVFAPLLTAIAMQAIGDSVARGLGMMGAFALLRFRTNIKDSRDMMFIFAALAVGLACGVYAYQIALISTIFFLLAVYAVHNIPFSIESDFDAILRFQVDNTPELQKAVDGVLSEHARRFSLISLREMAQGGRIELSYQLKMQEKSTQSVILNALSKVQSLRDAHLFLQDRAHEF